VMLHECAGALYIVSENVPTDADADIWCINDLTKVVVYTHPKLEWNKNVMSSRQKPASVVAHTPDRWGSKLFHALEAATGNADVCLLCCASSSEVMLLLYKLSLMCADCDSIVIFTRSNR